MSEAWVETVDAMVEVAEKVRRGETEGSEACRCRANRYAYLGDIFRVRAWCVRD